MRGRPVCRLHGGKGGGPMGESSGAYRTGRYTAEARAERRTARCADEGVAAVDQRLGLAAEFGHFDARTVFSLLQAKAPRSARSVADSAKMRFLSQMARPRGDLRARVGMAAC